MGFFFQAEDGIRDLVRSRGLGDVYKRQNLICTSIDRRRYIILHNYNIIRSAAMADRIRNGECVRCLLYTSDAADERSSVDLGGRRIIKKQTPPTHPPPPTAHRITHT